MNPRTPAWQADFTLRFAARDRHAPNLRPPHVKSM